MPGQKQPGTKPEKMLAIVAVVCAVILLVAWQKHRSARRIVPAITRAPLHPLTPPFTADRQAILAQFKAGSLGQVDRTLTGYETKAEADPSYEANVHLAFMAFQTGDPSLDPLLKRWIKMSPRSYAAHLGRAEFMFHQAWAARGDKWAYQTSQARFTAMNEFFAQGALEARTAIALDPRLSEAYNLLIQQQRSSGATDACLSLAAQGLKQMPASFTIRSTTMVCLEPRWGGNYQAMERFAEQAQKYAKDNPELRALEGFVECDRADTMWNQRNYAGALAHLNRAIEEGGDYARFYRERGKLMNELGRNADALEDLRRADQLLPQYPDTLEALAYALSAADRNQNALDRLNVALEVGGPRPYSEHLRNWIMNRVSTASAQAKVGGD